jgi:hypothetical protein
VLRQHGHRDRAEGVVQVDQPDLCQPVQVGQHLRPGGVVTERV